MAKIKTKAQEAEDKQLADKMLAKASQAMCDTDLAPISLLQEAHSIIHGDREQTYGSPEKNLNTIASYWSTHLTASCGEKITLTAHDVCVMMILLKQARLANNPGHRDSVVDTAGYAGLYDLISK